MTADQNARGPDATGTGQIFPGSGGRAHTQDMTREPVSEVWRGMAGWLRRLFDRLTHRGHRPPRAGVREPRRPRPNLPAAAVALDEPRTGLKRRIRLNRRRSA